MCRLPYLVYIYEEHECSRFTIAEYSCMRDLSGIKSLHCMLASSPSPRGVTKQAHLSPASIQYEFIQLVSQPYQYSSTSKPPPKKKVRCKTYEVKLSTYNKNSFLNFSFVKICASVRKLYPPPHHRTTVGYTLCTACMYICIA